MSDIKNGDGKRKFLQAVAAGNKSIDEIQDQKIIWFDGSDRNPGIVKRSDTGEEMTIEAARALSATKGKNIHWMEIKKYTPTEKNTPL